MRFAVFEIELWKLALVRKMTFAVHIWFDPYFLNVLAKEDNLEFIRYGSVTEIHPSAVPLCEPRCFFFFKSRIFACVGLLGCVV